MKLYISLTLIVVASITTPVLSRHQPQRHRRHHYHQKQQASTCRDPNTREGTCKPIRECQPLVDKLLVKQQDPVFTRYLRVSNIICGGAATVVCCPLPNGQTLTHTIGPLAKNSYEIPRHLPTVEEGCGYSRNTSRIKTGIAESKKGRWPWIALLGYGDELSSSSFKCGGTLITARHVVTAVHCLRSDLAFVRLGELDLTTDTETQHLDVRVVRSEKHPDYTSGNRHSDIAILYLKRNVEFTESISPICMPITAELKQKSYVNYTPFITGWGKTMENLTSYNVLQDLQIPIYENQVCRDRYRQQNNLLFTDNQFDNAVLCAGLLSGYNYTCVGDSGGPLMIPEIYGNSFRFYLIGVESYGTGCSQSELPGVYSSTQYFLNWIIQKVADTH